MITLNAKLTIDPIHIDISDEESKHDPSKTGDEVMISQSVDLIDRQGAERLSGVNTRSKDSRDSSASSSVMDISKYQKFGRPSPPALRSSKKGITTYSGRKKKVNGSSKR
jgi:hypothetical protein